jgi:3-dehydroquinate dehydratase II
MRGVPTRARGLCYGAPATLILRSAEGASRRMSTWRRRPCALERPSRRPIRAPQDEVGGLPLVDSVGNRVDPIVVVLNGPNLNLLGKREPEIYGRETLADVEADCHRLGKELGLSIEFHQSNREYELIDWIHGARERAAGIVINPAAFTHTSIAILDALNAFEGPIMEVHISNVHKREPFRHHSYVSGVASGVIVGCGTQGYTLALQRIAKLIGTAKS